MTIELSDISKTYNNFTALSNLNFSSAGYEFISVVGSSGAGKTTFFKILNGSQSPDKGNLLYDGKDFYNSSKAVKRQLQEKIGTVYQDFCLVEQRTCMDNVLMGALPAIGFWRGLFGVYGKELRREAEELLVRVGLEAKLENRVSELSGGQKQRVAIARALMQHPGLLLADEPVASLDPVTGHQILELIRNIQQQDKITVIMNSHTPEIAAEFSDRIIGLSGGEVVFDSIPSEMTDAVLSQIYGKGTEKAE